MYTAKKKKRLSCGLKTADFQKLFFGGFVLLLLSASIQCANIQQPTGGPKDSIPPKLLSENPKNLTTGFSAKQVVLSFDEFIKLSNANKEISISPEMDVIPTFKVKRKNLEMTLPDSLAENTTYVINFGQAIVDNNEGNPLRHYSYVFSTGDKIDSLSISGTVRNALTNEPEPLISVLLLPTNQDSLLTKKKANIFATTDSSGNFRLNYLRENTYRIYALKEQNNDRIYNNPEEWIGFLPDSIVLRGDTSGIYIRTSKPTPKDFRILDRKIETNGKILFSFNKALKEPDLKITFPDTLEANKIIEHYKTRDSLGIWLPDVTFDSLKVHIYDGIDLLDSVMLRRGKNDRYTNKITFTDNLDKSKVNKIKNLVFTGNFPIKSLDKSKLILKEDSLSIENFVISLDSVENKTFMLKYNWKAKKNYELSIEEGAVVGLFNQKNDKTSRKFTLDENDKYGDLSLKITLPDTVGTFVIELTDEKKQRVLRSEQIHKNTTISYKNFLEGKYKVRIVYDQNRNGKWDPGDLETNTQPERVWYYDKTFIIRPNWEQEEQISIPPDPDAKNSYSSPNQEE